jgi:tRNA-specific 2-thiouridylase
MDAVGKNVFVGLSGGVDSAVAAALLLRAGAHVNSVFIKGWYPPGLPCTWAADRRDAMRVAAHLRIPFVTLDAGRQYKQGVIDYLLAEYQAGRTPNPDVMCNREVKFGAFYRYAMERGADFIATGHYTGGPKDQRYFLWAVPKEVITKTLFPLGSYTKERVRALAKRFGLPVYDKPDSQGICFLGEVSVKDFLRHELGDNLAILHTIGERVAGGYVVGKDVGRGALTLAPVPRHAAKARFSQENRLGEWSGEVVAQYRYHGPIVEGRITGDVFEPHAAFTESLAPGQSIVFYRNDELVGGGIIEG